MEFVRYAFIAAGAGAIVYSLTFGLRHVRPEASTEPAERMQDLVRFSCLAGAGAVAILAGVFVPF